MKKRGKVDAKSFGTSRALMKGTNEKSDINHHRFCVDCKLLKRWQVEKCSNDIDHREVELGELISKLNDARRHTIEDATQKGVPMKALIHVAALFLSDDMNELM